jgi:hypothetical protein
VATIFFANTKALREHLELPIELTELVEHIGQGDRLLRWAMKKENRNRKTTFAEVLGPHVQ